MSHIDILCPARVKKNLLNHNLILAGGKTNYNLLERKFPEVNDFIGKIFFKQAKLTSISIN